MSATFFSIRCSPELSCCDASNSTSPSELTTFCTKCGLWYTPEAASVAYADAMSITRDWYWPNTIPLFGGPPCPSSDSVCSTPGKLSAIPA